ncbi:hypothetical protein JCM10213_000031 [Rhodosporidiobolus nylandii]
MDDNKPYADVKGEWLAVFNPPRDLHEPATQIAAATSKVSVKVAFEALWYATALFRAATPHPPPACPSLSPSVVLDADKTFVPVEQQEEERSLSHRHRQPQRNPFFPEARF